MTKTALIITIGLLILLTNIIGLFFGRSCESGARVLMYESTTCVCYGDKPADKAVEDSQVKYSQEVKYLP